MQGDDRGELWLPGSQEEDLDLVDPFKLRAAILNVAKLSESEVASVVNHLIGAGQFYQAARCLEVVAQERLGLDAPADQVLNPAMPGFGAFHATIYYLLRAGSLYGKSRRPKTAHTIFRRALLFIEESLRTVDRVRQSHMHDVWSVGVTFEMAGHVCVALSEMDGLDYYGAAIQYWDQAVRLKPEEVPSLTYHPVTRTVIGCLEQAAMARNVDENYREVLFTADYQTRIGTAKSLLR